MANGNPGFCNADGRFEYDWYPPLSPDGVYALLPLMSGVPVNHPRSATGTVLSGVSAGKLVRLRGST